MHIHILGICGTFMGGVAALATEAGHEVTGSDRQVYPPMSTQLESLGVTIMDEDDPAQLEARPDEVIVGNVMSASASRKTCRRPRFCSRSVCCSIRLGP